MKLLMIFSEKFSYKLTLKNLEAAENVTEGDDFENCIVAFIQAEEKDEEDIVGIEKKLVKNLKWAASKNNTKFVVLHSFAHLSESKANPEFTKELFNMAESRLQNADYQTAQTPFGYFLDLDMKAPGFSLARIFKSL
ncbi:MAG: threonyl-tRNA synthetase editing domain-containing protein [Bacteroidales bacterium]|nr:threonyl-tRNA synthetase editing domain-containing protein [Bacteroidales bacterium]MBN2756645.1 threonyl-tRNA synthetase editing domain-containing protein [Bacteroidales bacterium]